MHQETPVQLGNYELLSLVGAGGMGEVYRARDIRLPRLVAIKVLRGDIARSEEVRQRFEREARAISSLNHPHICTLYDIGRENGVDYLVMELVEGETLEDRLREGALQLDQAVLYAIQIADALDQAHRRGVVHRDLKPGNIMLTKAGVKLLDFGLAKLQTVSIGAPGQDPSMRLASREGTILGTPQYMAPEQVRGKVADPRTDIFALGAVLFEMIAGQRAFQGATEADVATAILSTEPRNLSSLQGCVPARLDHVVKRCLAKDLDERWQTARDVMLELEWIGEGPETAPLPTAAPSLRQWLGWITTAILAVALACFALLYPPRATKFPPGTVRFTVLPPADSTLEDSAPALSPDGSRLAFVATEQGHPRLWIRSLDSLTAQPLPGTEGASSPFWSPEGRVIAFFAGGKLKKIDLSGKAPQTLCDAPAARGGAWSHEGVILFAPRVTDRLYRIPAAGGEPTPVTKLDPTRAENSHRWPYFLPDGRHFLYFIRAGKPDSQGIFVGALEAKPNATDRQLLVNVDSNAEFVRSRSGAGFLLFVREGALTAQPFDAGRLVTTGEAFPVMENVSSLKNDAASFFSVSESGALAYADLPAARESQLVWFDRSGARLKEMHEPGVYSHLRLSQDAKQAALDALDPYKGTFDIWLVQFPHGLRTRFTSGPTAVMYPIWSPDGGQILFSSSRDGVYNLYEKANTGAGVEQLLYQSNESKWPTDWSRDGRFIIYQVDDPKTHRDLWALPMIGERKPFPFLRTEFIEQNARFSPNGRWVAYASDESGASEVYVRSFPDASGKHRVSSHGGDRPVWRGDGKELFYVAPQGELMAAPVIAGDAFETGAAERIGGNIRLEPNSVVWDTNYDEAANGQRFLAAIPVVRTNTAPITIVLNWPAQLSIDRR